MHKLTITKIDPIDPVDLNIILDCEFSLDNDFPDTAVSVIVSIFDSTQNFIGQKVFTGEEFEYNWTSEDALAEYIANEVIDIDGNPNLNAGLYELRFSFIRDTFNAVVNEDNRFIVSEISPDNTEIRLNPVSNETDFINDFTKIRNHQRLEKNIDLTDESFIEYYKLYVDFIFSDGNIFVIFSDLNVEVKGKTLTEYLTDKFANKSNKDTEDGRLSEGRTKANNAIEQMRSLLKSKKGDALEVMKSYWQNNKSGIKTDINNAESDNELQSIVNSFKIGLKNEMEIFLDDAVEEIVAQVIGS